MPTLMGIAPYVGINFTTYETLKQFLCKNPSKPTSTESLSYGGISGAVAQTVTYPIDLIRRRMQIQGFASNLQEYNNSFDVIKKIYTQFGLRGFYNGMLSCYLKVIPSIAISFWTFEKMKMLLRIEERTKGTKVQKPPSF